MSSRIPRLGWLVAAAAFAACSKESPAPESASAPVSAARAVTAAAAQLPTDRASLVPAPTRPVVLLRDVEFLTQHVVDLFDGLGRKLQVRDFGGASEAFTAAFVGHDPFAASVAERLALPLGADGVRRDATDAPLVDRAEFIASLARRMGPWRRVEHTLFKVHGAEFQQGKPPAWGRIDASLELIGETQEGGRDSVRGRMSIRVAREGEGWRIDGLESRGIEERRRETALFTDVTRAVGMHHEGLRFGQPGHDSDGWQGVAVADVDGDGWLDVFVPSSLANFLYVQQPDGRFRDEAAARGVAAPAGGTGALFFDFDGDGHVDLLVGHVGIERPDRSVEGNPVRFYRNVGGGRFEDRTDEMGTRVVTAASSLVAFDATGDGWLDVFVCGYGYMDRARNNSWVEATNGAPNFLLRNREGQRFEDVTREAGVWDTRWSYAAAAADFDRDGRQDLYVGNNFGSNRLWRNTGEGRFVDVAPALGVEERGNTMAVAWGDVDGDGRLDLYVVGPESAAGKRVLGRVREAPRIGQLKDLFAMADGNALFLGTDRGFERSPHATEARDAGWAFGSVIADLDLDGRADLFCVNGFVTGDLPEDT